MEVPESFPKETWPAAVSDRQLKHAARHIDGDYFVGRTSEARILRYCACTEVVQLLLAYCRSKLLEDPALSTEGLLQRVDAELLIEAPHLSMLEQAWCLAQVKEQL
jgi:hypothetical protein